MLVKLATKARGPSCATAHANLRASQPSSRGTKPKDQLERSLLFWDRPNMAHSATPPRVVVVSENPETVDGLQTYFGGVGIASETARTLDATASLPERTTAVVVFPDGFGAEDVISRVQTLHEERPGVLLLLVTREPRRFSAALGASRPDSVLVVLPKPAFGWTIVDAIRLHAQALEPSRPQ